VGAQTGKSAGSVLQQALLIMSAGSIHNILPVMCVVFLAMCNGWIKSVDTLADHHDFSKHFSMPATVTSSLDEEAATGEASEAGSEQQQPVPVPVPAS
jgi:AAA family ATP:ADP antiporter